MGNTVDVHINGHESVSSAVAAAIAELEKLKDKKYEIKIDVDKSAADKAVSGLEEDMKSLGKDKVDLDVDTSKARKKLTYLEEKKNKLADNPTRIELDAGPANSKLDRLLQKKEGFSDTTKIELDAGPANSKLDRLAQKKDKIFGESTKVEIDVDDAKNKLKELGDHSKDIKINVSAESVIEDIEDINMALDALDESKTINIDVDVASALAKIAALDAAINGVDDDSRINLDVDVDDVELLKMKGELAALKARRDSIDIDVDAHLNVDEDRIAELEDRIAEKHRLRVKAVVDDSEIDEKGLRDKRVTIDVVVNGFAKVEALHKMINSINSKTVTIDVNTRGDSKAIDKLTGAKNGKLKDIVQTIRTDVDRNSVNITRAQQREILAGIKERARALRESKFNDEMRAATDRVKELRAVSESIPINIDVDDAKIAHIAKKLESLRRQARNIQERDILIEGFQKERDRIEARPIKLRSELSKSSLRVVRRALDELEAEKRIYFEVDRDTMAKVEKYTGRLNDMMDRAVAKRNGKVADYDQVKIQADADVASAEAKLAALSRTRDARINVDVNEHRFQSITRIFNDIGDGASRAGNRIRDSFNDNDSGFSRTLRSVGRFSDGINRGIGSMTSRIPLVGGMFTGLSKLGEGVGGLTTKLGGMAGMSPKAAGALGGVAQAAISLGSALVGLGVVGVVGTGAITAGAYVAQAALGTVATVVGAVGAAIGGAFVGGFAYLVKDAPEVQAAYSKLGETVSATMKQLAQPVVMPIANAAPKLQAAFDQLHPTISRVASQTGNLVNELGEKLPAVAAQAGPALQKAFDFGESSLNSLMDNLPAITKSVGDFFGKMDSPEVRKAVNGAFAAIPGIVGGIGTGLEKAAAGFNNIQEFMDSSKLDPMREGFEKFSQSLSNTDWSSATSGITNAMNAFGQFAGGIDMQNIADGIGGISDGLASFTRVADNMNLDGIFSAVGTGFELAGKAAEGASSMFDKFIMKPIDFGLNNPIANAIKGAIGDVINELSGPESITVDGPSIELNPNITVKEQEDADIAKNILDNIDGKSFGSADAAERIINSLQGDLAKVKVKPEVEAIIDSNSIAKNVDASNIGKLLQSRIGDGPENAVKIPIQTAMDIETAAGKDGLNAIDTIKDQLSKLTGIAFDDINIDVPVGTTFKVSENADGSLGDLIKGTIDDQGNLQIEVVATANVVAQIAGVTGLDGGALDSFLNGVFNGQTISKDLAVQIKANMGLAGASMDEFDSALEGALSAATGKQFNVEIQADGSVKINLATPEVSEIPPIEPPKIPDVTADVAVKVAFAFGAETPQELNGFADKLKSLGAAGGESIEITKEIQVALEAVVGGGSEAEVQSKIKELISKLTNIPVEDLDIDFKVTPKPTVGDGPSGIMGNLGEEIRGKVEGATRNNSAPIDIKVPISVSTEIIGMKGDVGAELASKLQTKTGAIGGVTQQMKVQLVPDLSGLAGVLGAGVPMRVILIPDLSGLAGVLGAGVPMRVILIPDLSGIAGVLGAGVPMRVILIPDFAALGALPPIQIPSTILPPVMPQFALPPVQIPSVVLPPAIPMISIPPVTVTVNVVVGAIPAIPNTTSTHTVQVIAPPIPPYPNTTSTHTVVMNAPASTPSYPNTSSTHTVNIVVNGSLPGGGGSSTIRAAAMGAMNEMTSAARGIGAMGASIPMSAPSMSGGGRGVATIRRTGQAISESIGAGLLAGKNSIDKAVNEIGQAVGAIGPQVDKYLTDNSPEYAEAKRIGGELVRNISEGITSAQNQIGQAMDGINKFIADPIGEIDKALSANLPGYTEFKSNVEKTMDGVAEAAKVGSEGFQKIIAEEFVLPPMDQLEAKAREIGDGIGAALMGDPSKLAGTMDGIGQAISTKLGTVATRVGGVMDQVNQTMRDKVPGYADAQDKAIQFGQGLIQGVDNARQQMNTQLRSVGLPEIPTPQMAISGIQAEAAKVKTAFDGALNSLRVNAPAPVIPAPNLGPVKQALSTIPGAIETVNRVESDISKAKQNIESIPEVVKTKQTIEDNVGAVISQIKSLAGMDTTSTHTIRVQTLGGSGGAAGAVAKSSPMGIAMGAARGIMPMGASASVGGVSGTTGFIFRAGLAISTSFSEGIAAGYAKVEAAMARLEAYMFNFRLSIGSGNIFPGGTPPFSPETLGLANWKPSAALQHGVGQFIGKLEQKASTIGQTMNEEINKYLNLDVRGAYSEGLQNQLRKQMKPFSIDGFSYGAGEGTYHYYYQTVNNSFDGGLVGDPELQAKRVLEVLESTPSSRRYRQQGSVG